MKFHKVNLVLLFFLLLITLTSTAQDNKFSKETIKSELQEFFKVLMESDTNALRKKFLPGAQLKTVVFVDSIANVVHNVPFEKFIEEVKAMEKMDWEEKILSYDISIHNHLAIAQLPYQVFLKNKLQHEGVNVFTMILDSDQWKIQNLIDTRHPKFPNSVTEKDLKSKINTFMDNWHKAATTADEDLFFGSMDSIGVYLGTDPKEYWLRDEMKAWSKAFFEKETAWDFAPIKRNVYFSEDKKIAWFDEQLDTWMGICRGSGVLTRKNGEWKIIQYNLSVLIENEKVKSFLKIAPKSSKLKLSE